MKFCKLRYDLLNYLSAKSQSRKDFFCEPMNLRICALSVIFLFLGGLFVANLQAQSLYPGQFDKQLTISEKSPVKAYSFNMSDVKLLPSRFTENMERESTWIMSLQVDRLLHSFRTSAGVYAGLEGGYDSLEKLAGWESLDCELRGHTSGHVLSGLAMLYATTGDEKYKMKADSLVQGLAEVQKAYGNGYLSAFPENLINRNIEGQRVWAPWYTLHKIYAGLIDQYLYCNNEKALDIVKKMGDWAYNKLKNITTEQRKRMIRNEFGGVNDAFYALYEITGNDHYKWLGDFFYHENTLDPLKSRVDNLNLKHANTYIPKLIGIIRAYELGESEEYKSMSEFFWNTVVDHHSFCTGSNSDKEHFFKPDEQSHHLSGYTGESCNTYNMLKLTRHLFCLDADVKEADYYEEALYNHILGQQDPKTGMVHYFLPMLPGAYKLYSTPDSSFWCCVGTGFENHAKYGEAIYYHKDNDLFVNLFIPSMLSWKEKGVSIKQETVYPQNGLTKLTVSTEKPQTFAVKLRYPVWATDGVTVKVNGKKIKVHQQPGSYITLNRSWKNGDMVTCDFAMQLKENASDDSNVVYFTYGPVVLAGKMGTKGMTGRAPYSDPTKHNDYYTYDFHVPKDLSNELNIQNKTVTKWLKPVEGQPLTFRSDKNVIGREITFIPLYDLHRERYIVYWNLKK